jgi:dipicolinate synthase subunit A
MDRHTVIFTADKRLRDLGALLPGKRVMCSWDGYLKQAGDGVDIESVYVFPTPVAKLKNYGNTSSLKDELTFRKVTCVFGGIFDEEWCAFLEQNKISHVDFTQIPEVVEENANITAEGVVAELLQLSAYSIFGQSICVVGFGACGRAIARKLSALGGNILVVARGDTARAEAKTAGYESCDFTRWRQEVGKMMTIINTVPALVITQDILGSMSKEAVILDIASKPGGTDFVEAAKKGIPAKLALGLPGIYSTKSSALTYKKAMLQHAPLQDIKEGEESWIFQIII